MWLGHSRKLPRFAGRTPRWLWNFDAGVPWVDAEDDFARARRRHVLGRLVSWLRREPEDTGLLRFDEVVSVLGFRGEYYLGLRTIRLDTVVGTVEEARGFDRRFRPASDRERERWELVDLAERHGAVMPPIEVYRLDGLHFVKDGHHRVSVAIATGQQMIDADVTEVLTKLPATGISRHSDLMRIANSAKERLSRMARGISDRGWRTAEADGLARGRCRASLLYQPWRLRTGCGWGAGPRFGCRSW